MTLRNRHREPLTGLQQAILDFVSTAGPATAEEVRAALSTSHPLKDSSVRTLLRRLEVRGLVSHTVEGKVFRYKAEMPPARVAAEAVARLINGFWAGSAERFLSGLVDEKVLSPRDLERLARKIQLKRNRP